MNTTIVKSNDTCTVQNIAEVLLKDELVIMPCDTIYGIVGRAPQSKDAMEHVKGRPEGKPFLQLTSFEILEQELSTTLDLAIARRWPGPLTAILPTKSHGSVAFRIPADPFLISIIRYIGQPLYSTSVNLSGQPALNTFEEIIRWFDSRVSLIVEGEVSLQALPSTIIDATTRPYKLIRQGAMDVKALIDR